MTPSRIVPQYTTTIPNQKISLYEGEVEIDLNGDSLSKGHCLVDFVWVPSVAIKFSMDDPTKSLSLGKVRLNFLEVNTSYNAHINYRNFSFGNSCYRDQIGGCLGECKVSEDLELTYAVFHLTNFDKYWGAYFDKSYCMRLVLESEEWKITIDSIDTGDLFKLLEKEGGYAITHVGRIERIDGQTFRSDTAHDVLFGLHLFLSFSSGISTSLILPSGYDSTNKKIWEEWSFYSTAPYQVRRSWFPWHEPNQVSEAFAGFFKLWGNPGWKDSLKYIISWYVQANSSTDIDSPILLLQSAFELLGWLVLVQDKKTLSPEAYKVKLSAADKLRLLFSFSNLPLTIEQQSGSPELHTEHLQKALKGESGKLDFVGIITEIRNKITHPITITKKNKTQQNELSIFEYSSQVRLQALNLSLWYLELSLLRIFDYRGQYSNRLKKTRYSGNYENLP